MFHIPNDPRALRSAELVCAGLSACLCRKPFAEISVTEICDAGGIGRTTFYRLFDNPTDILAYQYEMALRQVLQRYSPQSESLMRVMMDVVIENEALTGMIVRSGRIDILADIHRRHFKQLLACLPADAALSEREAEYLISILSGSLVSVASVWGKGEQRPSGEALYTSLSKVFRLLESLL